MTLLALAVAWLIGIFLGVRLGLPLSALVLFAVAVVLLTALLATLHRSLLPTLLLAVMIAGALRVELFHGDPTSALAVFHTPSPILVEGVVINDPEAGGATTRFRLEVDRLAHGDEWQDASGYVLVTLRGPAENTGLRTPPYVRYGDRLLLEGVLKEPPTFEDFDYPAYLARQDIGSVMSFPEINLVGEGEGVPFYRWLYSVRRSIADSLAKTVPEPQASLGQALLLGIRDNLPPDLEEKFRATGTSHLLAISGLHVGILLGLSLAASQWAFGRRKQLYLIAPFVLLWLYALIAGMSPSVARAAIMGSVFLAALALGRPRSVLPALGLAAAVLVGQSPNVLWSVSFQLSFAAMAGIALLARPIDAWLQARSGARLEFDMADYSALAALRLAAAMTIAATVATLPLVAFYFQHVSLVGLPATVLALPALPAILVSQALAGIVGLLAAGLAVPFGWMAWATTAYLTGVVDLFSRLPGASFETGPVAPVLVWVYYAPFVVWLARRPLRTVASRAFSGFQVPVPPSIFRRQVPWWVLVPVASAAAVLWIAAFSLPDGKLHVTFADVGQGDAILITTPSGQHVLVDGGPGPVEAARLLGAALPFWDRSIELAVLTHAHSDHSAGLVEVLRRYDVFHILERETIYDSQPYDAWRQAAKDEGALITQAQAGQVLVFDDGVSIQVLGPPGTPTRSTESDVNNSSVVLRVVYGDISFLLTGDILREAEERLVARGAHVDSDVLKVAHHGSRSSSSEVFLRSVTPAAAVISVGEDNRFGHPHLEAVDSLLRHVDEEMLLMTKDHGTIEFVTDGRSLEVKTQR